MILVAGCEGVDVMLSLIYLVGPLLTELIMGSDSDCLGYLASNIIFCHMVSLLAFYEVIFQNACAFSAH